MESKSIFSVIVFSILSVLFVSSAGFAFDDVFAQTPRNSTAHEYVGGPPPTASQLTAALMTSDGALYCDVKTVGGVPVDPEQAEVFTNTTPIQDFPAPGSSDYVVLSTGQAINAPGVPGDFFSTPMGGLDNQVHPFTASDPNADDANDVAKITIECTFPANADSLSVDWMFGSEEISSELPDFVDYFRGTIDGVDFVFLPGDLFVTTNNAFPTFTSVPDDTIFNEVTDRITSSFDLVPLQGLTIEIVFEVADDFDTIFDSAAFIDNFDVTVSNTSPTADSDATPTVDEDGSVVINLTGSDADGDALTFAIVSNPNPLTGNLGAIGAVNCTGATPNVCDADVTYTPVGDFNGADSFTFKVNDGTVDSASATVNVTVDAVNDEPSFAAGANQTKLEGTSGLQTVTGWATAISAGPSDESGQVLTFNISNDNNGLFSTQPSVDETTGDLTYTLIGGDLNGVATVTLNISDDGGTANGGDNTSDDQLFDITVTPVNDEPSFTKGSDVLVNEDSGAYDVAFATALSKGPADESGQVLTFSVSANNTALFSVQPAVNGMTGNLTFTTTPDANGIANVTISVSDDGGLANGGDDTSPDQSFFIRLTAINDPPTANDEDIDASISEDETNPADFTAELIAAVDDVDLDPLLNFPMTEVITIIAVETTDPAKGNATLASVLYEPNGAFEDLAEGELEFDLFSYTAEDVAMVNSTAIANVTIVGKNDAPTANDDDPRTDEYDSPKGVTLVVSAVDGLLINDTDPDQNESSPDDIFSATLVPGSFDTLKLSSVTVDPDGGFTVVPVSTFAGEATFNYTVTDFHENGTSHSPVTSDNATATVAFYSLELSRTLYSVGEDAIPLVIDPFADSELPDTDPDTLFVDMESTNSPEGVIMDYNLTEIEPTADLYIANIKILKPIGDITESSINPDSPIILVQLDDFNQDTITVSYRDLEDSATIEGAPGLTLEPNENEPLRFSTDRYHPEETGDLGLILGEPFTTNGEVDIVSVFVRTSSSPSGYLVTLNEDTETPGDFETSNPFTLTSLGTIAVSNQIHTNVGDTIFASFEDGDYDWLLSNGFVQSVDIEGTLGEAGDIPVVGNWDGLKPDLSSGPGDTIGFYRISTGQWFLTNTFDEPIAILTGFGSPAAGDIPAPGDWNNDGIDTPGVYRGSTGQWLVTDGFYTGVVSHDPFFGSPSAGDIPVPGDWDGDGFDTPGIYRGTTGQWLLTNDFGSGTVVHAPFFGSPLAGDIPVPGDWNGDGVDTPGIYRSSTGQWLVTDDFTSGTVVHAPFYGDPTLSDIPVVGNFDGLKPDLSSGPGDTIGIVRIQPGTIEAEPAIMDPTQPNDALQIIGFTTNTSFDCALDTNLDGVCDEWILDDDDVVEGGTKIQFSINGALYVEQCRPLLVDNDPNPATTYTATSFTTVNVCPKIDHKQVRIEVDHMPGHKTPQVVMENLIDMFANGDVQNGDNVDGVDLFITVDQTFDRHINEIVLSSGDLANPGADEFKQAYFGTAEEQARTDAPAFLTGKFFYYRYGEVIHLNSDEGPTAGQAEIGGNDFWIHGGALFGGVGTNLELERAFAHEVGHTIALRHDVNCGPNWPSVMNYMFQDTDIVPGFLTDYSRDALLDLDETNLNEKLGIQLALDRNGAVIPTAIGAISPDSPFLVDTGETNVNFNQAQSNRQTGVSANISFFDIDPACQDALTILPGIDDWANIEIPFRLQPHYADGVHTSTAAHKDRGGSPGQSPETSVDHNTPIAQPQTVVIPEATSEFFFDVFASDPNGDDLTYFVPSNTSDPPRTGEEVPQFGTASIEVSPSNISQTVKFVPSNPSEFTGDMFDFFVEDSPSGKQSPSARVVIIVDGAPSGDEVNVITEESTPITFLLTGTDPNGDPLEFYPDPPSFGSLSQAPGSPMVTFTPPAGIFGAATFDFTVNDGTQFNFDENVGKATVIVAPEVTGASPIIIGVTPQIIAIDTTLTLELSYSDSDTGPQDTHLVDIDWGDIDVSPEDTVVKDVISPTGLEVRTPSFIKEGGYAATGVYRITVTVTTASTVPDFDEQEFLIAVYDPSAGFVTGGGTIDAPAPAFEFDGALITEIDPLGMGIDPFIEEPGYADFGFVSKYQKGKKAPTGQTTFEFHATSGDVDMRFKSGNYEFLVIAGSQAIYKGWGELYLNDIQIHGENEWGFMISAEDGDINPAGNEGDGTDNFRIKIWDKRVDQPVDSTAGATDGVLFDNARGEDEEVSLDTNTELTSGSITVHKAEKEKGGGGKK